MFRMKKEMLRGPAVCSVIWYRFSQKSWVISLKAHRNASGKLSKLV